MISVIFLFLKIDIFLGELGMVSSPIDERGTQSIIPKEFRIGKKLAEKRTQYLYLKT